MPAWGSAPGIRPRPCVRHGHQDGYARDALVGEGAVDSLVLDTETEAIAELELVLVQETLRTSVLLRARAGGVRRDAVPQPEHAARAQRHLQRV